MQKLIPTKVNEQQVICMDIEWECVSFLDNYISIFLQGRWLNKFPVLNSKRSLNNIKSHYLFKNSPQLKVELKGQTITKILNVNILFYYIHFFENSGKSFADFSKTIRLKYKG